MSEDAAGTKVRNESLATNRKARRDYQILDVWEAGIELRGHEVKSIRAGDVSLNECFARVENGSLILHGMHVKPYAWTHHTEQVPTRPRRLLMHRQEIRKLIGKMTLKGLALVPLRLYLKRGRVKVEMALGRGKHFEDKRETLKRKTADREAERAMRDR